MSEYHVGFVFPAFTSDYSEHPGRTMPGFDIRFREFLLQAAGVIDPELTGFDFTGTAFPGDELRAQYITYVYSCTAASLLRSMKFVPRLNAGYSMGIYAALQDAKAISFETGLSMIRSAYRSLSGTLTGKEYGMGSLIGLDEKDIQQIIRNSSLEAGITNQNAAHSFVVSGKAGDIRLLMEQAREEGALHTRDLSVSIPYHSGFLEDAANDFANTIRHLDIRDPETPTISLIDQRLLSTSESIRHEVARNLFCPLNWYRTMQVMIENHVTEFIECGPSKGLVKNAKFVDGASRFHALNAIPGR